MTRIDEIVDGIYRISTFSPDFGISFNQFLIDDEEPALIHTGTYDHYEGVRTAIAEVLDPDDSPTSCCCTGRATRTAGWID